MDSDNEGLQNVRAKMEEIREKRAAYRRNQEQNQKSCACQGTPTPEKDMTDEEFEHARAYAAKLEKVGRMLNAASQGTPDYSTQGTRSKPKEVTGILPDPADYDDRPGTDYSVGGHEKFEVTVEVLPVDSQARKDIPLVTGLFDYFPAALAEVAKVSKAGNDKHNPGEPMHWARSKSMDQADCIGRHLMERGGFDPETGQRHTAQLAWRALALLQLELEADGAPLARGARP